ncbi:MAG: hypothetical protein WA146_06580 [Thiobacillus sp.]
MNEKSIIPKWLSFLPALAIGWLLIAGLLLFQLWPDLPQTSLQWFLLVAFGPPLYVLGEGFFSWLLSSKHGKAISNREFSFVRVLVALPIMLAVFALCWWLSWLFPQ